MRKGIFFGGLWMISVIGLGQNATNYSIIPKPARLEARSGYFIFGNETVVTIPAAGAELEAIANRFVDQLNQVSGLAISAPSVIKAHAVIDQPGGSVVAFQLIKDAGMGEEGYRLDVKSNRILVEAQAANGFFYAIQTLYQLLPPEIIGKRSLGNRITWALPACRIEDRPRYSYRGLHLDVSRHFFPISFIKKYIDLIAFHKLNVFHWHLTDDQGWRIEIKKYPKLTQVGSKRRETLIGHYEAYDPQQFDGQPYTGYYTQEEIREVVRYAQDRYVTVIPEIEMPGHALAALAAYPELGCSGGPYEVATRWGIFSEVFCPYEYTFTFLQDVLTEVMELFPSRYIHIGGDECPKASWRDSEFCQGIIKELGLKGNHQLQGYFLARIDTWLTSKGRKIIGWDEILEGGLSPNATVMSWRGTVGGIEAAQQEHDAIMTPSTFLYLDHYQSDPAQGPIAIHGFTTLEKTYSYDPTPANLPIRIQKHIIGAQANVWTEYMKTPEEVEYMVWPRAAALAEVVWTPRKQKCWPDFSRRIKTHFERLRQLDVHYSRAYYDILARTHTTRDARLQIILTPKDTTTAVYYTTDGTLPTPQSLQYVEPILLSKTTTIKAVAVQNEQVVGKVMSWEFIVSKATGKPYLFTSQPNYFKGRDPLVLTNGLKGFPGDLATTVRMEGTDLNLLLDLEKIQNICAVTIGFVKVTIRNTILPEEVEIAVSDDGHAFKIVTSQLVNSAERGKREIVRAKYAFQPIEARYIRIFARNAGQVPEGLLNAGKTALIAVDEITVD